MKSGYLTLFFHLDEPMDQDTEPELHHEDFESDHDERPSMVCANSSICIASWLTQLAEPGRWA